MSSVAREQVSFRLDSELLPELVVTVRRSPRARHVRLHVDEHGDVIASIPRRFALRRLEPIVRDRLDWLEEHVTRIQATRKAAEVDLAGGGPARLHGRWFAVDLVTGVRRSSCVIDGERISMRVRDGDDPYEVLERFYREHARQVIGERVAHFAAEYGHEVAGLSIRDQRTRWGSCTAEGRLSFNWRLVLAPAWVLDAIVVHELCHIDELNHSRRFWTLLDRRYPRHRDASAWLAEHGPALRMMRPAPSTPPMPQTPAARGRRRTGTLSLF